MTRYKSNAVYLLLMLLTEVLWTQGLIAKEIMVCAFTFIVLACAASMLPTAKEWAEYVAYQLAIKNAKEKSNGM